MAIKFFKGWKIGNNTYKVQDERADNLGTASTKNSTSVVTDSSDLVESGAVKDIVGWGNKNLLNLTLDKLKVNNSTYTWNGDVISHNGASISFIESVDFVNGIVINGTVTEAFNVRLTDTRNLGYQGKILNGTVDIDKEYLYAYDDALPGSVSDSGNGVTIPDTFTNYRIVINVKAGTHNNEVIYPMVSKDGGAYEPYHESVDETKADNTVIAPVENNATASKDYAVGDYFIKDTILGKTKAAIASGGTFTKDTNYEETNVAKELTELYKYIGILTTPVEAFTANSLPILKRNITNAFYNGSLRAEIAAGNFKNVRPGDYIIGQATGSIYYVAECDYWLGNGDSTNGTTYPAYNTHHLGLMLFKPVGTTALWKGYGYSDKSWRVSASDLGRCPWNADTTVDPTDTEAIGSNSTNITRSYNGTNMSAYMGSFIRERIDAILLPQCFQADFGSENVLKRRNWLSNAINASSVSGARSDWQGIANGSVWVDRFIDLASEVELYGSRINSSSRDDIGVQNKQLPIYRNGRIHDFYPRMDLWTKGIASSSVVAYRSGHGIAAASLTSYAVWAAPLACVR